MLRLGNVATPLTAFTGAPPESVPLPGFAPSPSVIAPVNPGTTCSAASSAATWTGGAIVAPATAFWGCCVNPRWVGGGGGDAVMVKAALVVTGVALPNAAGRGEPAPVWAVCGLGNVGTPATPGPGGGAPLG